MATAAHKFKSYDASSITLTFYKKNELAPCTVPYAEYLKLRSYEIDFSRQYSLNLPRGLCREIERHYLTYLHQCNPLIFVKCLPTVDSSPYFVNYLAHSTASIFDEFMQINGCSISNNLINGKAKRLLDQKITSTMQAIEYGILLHINSKYKLSQLYNLLRNHNFDPNLYIVQIKENEFLLDYRIYGLLYDELNETVFDADNTLINQDDSIHAQWLKREGEETYIYFSDDELITKIVEISLKEHKPDTKCYVLCPISASHNQFIPRLCYEEVLKNSLEINDLSGYPVEIREGKRIIHFKKMLLADALPILKNIVDTNPQNYSCLKKFIALYEKTN